MKNSCLILLITLFFYSCDVSKNEKSDRSSIKEEVNTLLVEWHEAASDANFNDYFRKLDSTSIYIGTAAEEIWTKKQFAAFSKPYFEKGKAWSFKALERTIYISDSGDFVWFDELLNTWMGTCRGSGVLEKVANSWKIKHYVLSVVIPNEDIQTVINAKKKNDSIFLEKYKK